MNNDIAPGKRYGDEPIRSARYSRDEKERDHLDLRGFNLQDVIGDLAAGKAVRGLSGEILQEYANRNGVSSRRGGVRIPSEVFMRAASDHTTVTSRSLVGTDHLGDEFVDYLGNQPVVKAAGATTLRLDPQTGNVEIPRQTGATTAFWVAEDDAPQNSVTTYDSVTATPHTVAAYTDISRRLMLQSDPSIDALIRSDLAATLRRAIDKAALQGNGLNESPAGIATLHNGDVRTPDSADAIWGTLIDAETDILVANSNVTAVIMGAVAKGILQSSLVTNGGPDMIMDIGQNTLLGKPVYISNQLSDPAEVILGNFADLVFVEWSGVDLLVDPYSLSTTGAQRVTAFADVDFIFRHEDSFQRVNVNVNP